MSTSTAISGPRRRVLTYDALRTFAILSVVAIHCFMPLRPLLPHGSWARIVDDMLHYAVPVFVFISGALVWGRHRAGGWSAFKGFVQGRVDTVAMPYLAWALLYLGVSAIESSRSARLLARAPELLLTGHVWYHLYFVPMLLLFYLMTPVATRLIRRWPEASVAAVYALRVFAWPEVFEWLQTWAPEPVWSFSTHIATHLPHMVLGAWFAVRISSPSNAVRRAWPVLLGGGTAVLLARAMGMLDGLSDTAAHSVYPVGMAMTVLGIALGAFWLEPHYDRFPRTLVRGATLSFGVFFVHPLLLLGLWTAVDAMDASRVWLTWWAIPLTWAAVSSASYAIAWALAKSHRTAWLVGVRAGAGG